ncbi:MAG: Y-family DNA polymerase [Sphaerochaetaceae bacterium]|nr:Y-family DNA polymerase [Sphaerochaetaceae bacterium]MDC7237701.1 Y-family DNA polymerase [Sphaerochaetaceae bacterium]
MMVGLCDCNNFYASCERLFRPDLKDKPIVILSNNDGCLIALSKEAKALNLKRGMPYFKCEQLLKKNNVHVFSSNYTLYQDISDRVMQELKDLVGIISPYSIDEAFFKMPKHLSAQDIRDKISQNVGIPVSIGVARTKTLAKIANHIGKTLESNSLYLKKEWEGKALYKTPIEEIWGIGKKKAQFLRAHNIFTALDLTKQNELWIRKNLSVTTLETLKELKGIPAISIENSQTQNLCSGISFSSIRTTYEELEQAISCQCTILGEKLVNKDLVASSISINIFTNRFEENYIAPISTIYLEEPTNYIPALINAAKIVLKKIYVKNKYKGCRVWANNLNKAGFRQLELFKSETHNELLQKQDALAYVVNDISKTYGRKKISSGATNNLERNNLQRRDMLSPCYTTKWEDIPVINLK